MQYIQVVSFSHVRILCDRVTLNPWLLSQDQVNPKNAIRENIKKIKSSYYVSATFGIRKLHSLYNLSTKIVLYNL